MLFLSAAGGNFPGSFSLSKVLDSLKFSKFIPLSPPFQKGYSGEF